MTLRHMKIFVAVCEAGSITGAAKKLYLAQPAVSLAVRELEDYYGVRLFDRIAKKLYITEAGTRFLSYARHITSLFDELEQGVRSWESSGSLRVGASVTIGTYLLPGYVSGFARSYPEITVKVTVDNSEVIEGMVLSNDLDLALIEGTAHEADLISESYLGGELVLVAAPGHPLAEAGPVPLSALEGEPLLLREKGSGTRELVDSTFLTHEVGLTPLWESTSTQSLLNAVKAGLGLSILPLPLVEQELLAGRLARVAVEGADFKRRYSLIHHKNKYLTPSARAFMALCRDAGQQSTTMV